MGVATVRRAEVGGGWVAECPAHACFVSVDTRHAARTSDTLDFCDGCRDAADAPDILDLEPFRSGDFDARREREGHDTAERCVLCWRVVDPARAAWVHCVSGGFYALRVGAEYANSSADMGFWPVGPECGKRVPSGYIREEMR